MATNILRQKLDADEPTLCTHVHNIWPSMAEIIGHSGLYDYVEFEAEYAPFGLAELENFCRAVELHGMSSIIKIDQEPRRFLSQRGIGAGFHGVLFADVRSPDDASECVRACRAEISESAGTHGVATRRAFWMTRGGSLSYGGSPEFVKTLDDIVVALMIEKQPAVEQLEQILSVPGVDMIQWGPYDYGMSIGRPGAAAAGDSEIKKVEKQVIEACLKHGVVPRAEIDTPEDAKYYMDLGVRHFAIGTDTDVYFDWLRRTGEGMREAMSKDL